MCDYDFPKDNYSIYESSKQDQPDLDNITDFVGSIVSAIQEEREREERLDELTPPPYTTSEGGDDDDNNEDND